MKLTADFETTTDENDCRVWGWATSEIGNADKIEIGNDMNSFFNYIQTLGNSTLYFHNLKFDGEYVISYLFKQGFKHVVKKEDEENKTFTTLISDTGQFYSIKIIFKAHKKKPHTITLLDSMKIIPFRVSEVAKAFGLPISKLEIDYKAYRPVGHVLTKDEREYIKNDVKIMALALEVLFSQGLTKMTQASNALADYKKIITKDQFKRHFPIPNYDKAVRQSYKGGFTYLNKNFKEKDIKSGIVYDINSLYPFVMREKPLPFGDPIFFEGEYKPDKFYPLYVVIITCQFELKKGYIPTIQIKNNLNYVANQYLETSETPTGDEVTLCLTNVDLELFLRHYNVYNLHYHCGFKFKSSTMLFKDYIDKWIKVKIESTINDNKGMRTLSKLMLNALYGKFGLNPNVQSKIPYLHDGIVKYRLGEKETREPLYIPVASFVTAHARYKTISSAQMLYDRFVYADTDSLHLQCDIPKDMLSMSPDEIKDLTTSELIQMGVELPNGFEVHPTKLGAWKIENYFYRARFIRQKCYMEDENPPHTWNTENYNKDLLKITCAGMPEGCYPFVNWDNFKVGATYQGKLQPKHVKGGIILSDIDFTIKPC